MRRVINEPAAPLKNNNRGSSERKRIIDAILGQLNVRSLLGDDRAFDVAVQKVINKLALKTELTGTSLRLFILLAGKMNRRTGYCYPGVGALASELNVTPQAVRKACRELEMSGFIHVERNASALRTNLFFLDFRGMTDSTHRTVSAAPDHQTDVSGSLSRSIFGETDGSGLSAEDHELLALAEKRVWRHG